MVHAQKILRDRLEQAQEHRHRQFSGHAPLGIAPSTEVNPMTTVAEGAVVFAESIGLLSQSRGRKSARGSLSAGGRLDGMFNYMSWTHDFQDQDRHQTCRALAAPLPAVGTLRADCNVGGGAVAETLPHIGHRRRRPTCKSFSSSDARDVR